MPLYEYQCDACGHRFEALQKFSDPPLDRCPKCGGALRKLQAAPAFQFKGSGWYITDYARKDTAAAAKTESGAKEAPAAERNSTSEKTESKAEKTGSRTETPPAKSDKTDKT
jgi:putative FmdB family regulatory protein